ncbi:MAG TPA: hypothetical protein VFD18_01460 [Chthoniobacterales bacterium]|jgi:hypothetical protein|nr:hypothetical protein [Chthoniobacterales bacterium]
MRTFVLPFLAILALAGILDAQSTQTMVVPAATPVVTTKAPGAGVTDNTASLQAALKMLQEMKTANEETLRKQEATLEQLDLIQQAADQLKIYSKRG